MYDFISLYVYTTITTCILGRTYFVERQHMINDQWLLLKPEFLWLLICTTICMSILVVAIKKLLKKKKEKVSYRFIEKTIGKPQAKKTHPWSSLIERLSRRKKPGNKARQCCFQSSTVSVRVFFLYFVSIFWPKTSLNIPSLHNVFNTQKVKTTCVVFLETFVNFFTGLQGLSVWKGIGIMEIYSTTSA